MFLYLFILLKRNRMDIFSVKRLKIRTTSQTLTHKLAHTHPLRQAYTASTRTF